MRFFLKLIHICKPVMKKKGKYNTLLLVKAFILEPNAPLIVTGLKEGVPPLGGQFIAARPSKSVTFKAMNAGAPLLVAFPNGGPLLEDGPFTADPPLKILLL